MLNFQWKNCSIFNNSTTIGLNILNPLWCTPSHQRVSNHNQVHDNYLHDLGLTKNLSMLSFTSQKPQLPIHSINKIMLNSSNFLLKCAPKPYPKVWFYQLVLGGGVQLKICFSFFFFFGGQWATFIGPWYVWSLQWYLDKKIIVGPLHIVMRKIYFFPNLSHVWRHLFLKYSHKLII
jgi:hypothetical protein